MSDNIHSDTAVQTNDEKGVMVRLSRRSVLKLISATILATTTSLVPELKGVREAYAFQWCWSGHDWFCCDCRSTTISCQYQFMCGDANPMWVQYAVICEPVFGCNTCQDVCSGPYYHCSPDCSWPCNPCTQCPEA